jgi:hypothetical protein
VWTLAALAKWLERRRLRITDLRRPLAVVFLKHRPLTRRGHAEATTLRLFLDHLETHAVIPASPLVDLTPVARLKAHYEAHLALPSALKRTHASTVGAGVGRLRTNHLDTRYIIAEPAEQHDGRRQRLGQLRLCSLRPRSSLSSARVPRIQLFWRPGFTATVLTTNALFP